MDDTPNVPGALSLIAEHLPKWWADEGTKDLRDGLSNFVPTDAVDAGLMLVGGPGGKMARKAGAALIAGGASTDAEAGIFKKLPGELRGLVRLLAANAKKADPAEAAIEFANNGLGGKLARGGHGVVDSSKLVFNPNGAALHTHGYAEQALPSFKDFETWAAQPAQKYLGVVKPSRQGKPGAVIIAPKGSALPTQGELAQFQKSLFKSNPNLVNRLDFGESDASKWKWLLDKANADELDLFLHNTTAPAELMYPGFKTPKATLDELLQASLEQKGSRGEDALLSYLSDGHEDINAALRNGEGADEVARNMDKLFSANEGVRPLENDLAVWRYSTSFPKHDPAFLSTTLSEEFARKNAGAGQVKKIIVPAGERAFDTRNVAPYAYEQEVLLPRGGNLTPIDENTLMFNRAEQGYAQGGAVNKPQGMEHTTSSSQDASTQPLTGSALKALVRGWIAGTAGLPGDIEGLARKGVNWSFGPGGVNVDEAPALPTSEFYKDWLPGKQQGDEMINDIGSVFGGVGATKPVSLTKGALSRVAAAAPGPMAGSRAAMRGVIKAPGGNWLSGSVEDALNGLKRGDFEAIAQLQRVRPGLSVEEARAFIQAPPPSAENVALNNFVDKQLTRYVQKDMATERDPIRALAERGVLHYAPEMVSIDPPRLATQAAREQAGFPRMGNSTSVLAKQWEALSDKFIDPAKAGELTSGHGQGGPFLSQNPWLTKLAPDTPVYELGATARSQDLGFDHLMDELRNAVNINSGLPAHLRLDPESLARVSVPQAVERVAKINDWRAAQKVAADQARANNAATVLHKEYPEGNYFRAGEGSFFTPDQQAAELFGKNFGGKVGRHRLDPKKTATEADLEKAVREYGVLQEGVPLGQYLEQGDNAVTPYSSFIREALRKQGFDSVSLNDGMAKQPSLVALDDSIIKPHTDNPKGFKWVELKSGDLPEGWSQRKDALGVDIVYGPDGYSTNAGSIKDPRRAALADALKYEGDTMGHCVGGYCDEVASGKSRIYSLRDAKGQPHTTIEVEPDIRPRESFEGEPTPRIVQIKGKGNRAPNREYLPYVQDFVKSGKWSDVGDLQNSGLVKHPSGYLTQEELQALGQAPQGYATGGTVTAPAPTWLDTYNSWLNQYKGQFGGQDMNRAWDADPDAVKQKTALDDTYLAALAAYNKANGTNLAPDSAVLGASAQPNTFTPPTDHSRDGFFGHAIGAIGDTLKDPSKGLTNLSHDIAKSPLANAALTAVGSYFGIPPAVTAALLGANRTGVDGDIGAGAKVGIESYGAGKLMPDLGWGQAAQTAAGNTVSSLLNGNNIGDSIKNAGISYVGGQAGAEAKDFTGSDFAGKAANSLTQTALKGKDIGSTLDQLATQYASGQLTDLSGMDPKMAAIVVNLARNKKGAATNIAAGALTQAAQRAVGSAKLSARAVGA